MRQDRRVHDHVSARGTQFFNQCLTLRILPKPGAVPYLGIVTTPHSRIGRVVSRSDARTLQEVGSEMHEEKEENAGLAVASRVNQVSQAPKAGVHILAQRFCRRSYSIPNRSW